MLLKQGLRLLCVVLGLWMLAATAEDRGKVALLRDFERNPSERSVPDPYHGGERGFDEVFEICEAACCGLLSTLVSRLER